MRVRWQKNALDDIRAIVPEGFRQPLRAYLHSLLWVGQGMRCMAPRYCDGFVIKFRNWYVVYREVQPGEIGVIAVEYNYGQEV